MSSVNVVVSHASIDFDDYPADKREQYEDTHMFVGFIVSREHIKSLGRLGTPVLLVFSDVAP